MLARAASLPPSSCGMLRMRASGWPAAAGGPGARRRLHCSHRQAAKLGPEHVASLARDGYLIVEDFLDAEAVRGAVGDITQLHQPAAPEPAAGSDRPGWHPPAAAPAGFKSSGQDPAIRDDSIYWLTPEEATAAGFHRLASIAKSVLGELGFFAIRHL